MNSKLFLIIPLILSGCSSIASKQDSIVEDKVGVIYIKPEAFMKECEKLSKLENGSQKELVNFSLDTVNKYKECSNKQKELKDWIERNIK